MCEELSIMEPMLSVLHTHSTGSSRSVRVAQGWVTWVGHSHLVDESVAC
jgi:hypothetical protein